MVYDEIKYELKKKYPYKIELHAHTNLVSGCSFISPEEMAETYLSNGYSGVVITDHYNCDFRKDDRETAIRNYMKGYEAVKAEGEKRGLKVYLGAEIRFTEAYHDYLVIGADSEVIGICYDYFEKGIETFKREASLDNTLIVQAHPFRNREPIGAHCIDGIEVFNMHPNHNSRIALAARFAKENGIKIVTAGSDYHDKGWGALCAVRTARIPNDSFEIAEILKKGDYVLEVGDTIIIP